MNRILKIGVAAGFVMLAIPLCSLAAEVKTEKEMRDSALTQEERDKITLGTLRDQEAKEDVGEYFDDVAITAKVKGKFVGQRGLESLDIKVVTVEGTTTLLGEVNNAAQISLAEEVAKDVEGVKAVDNRLVVKQ